MADFELDLKPGQTATIKIGKTHVVVKGQEDGSVVVAASDPEKGLDEATLLDGDKEKPKPKPE